MVLNNTFFCIIFGNGTNLFSRAATKLYFSQENGPSREACQFLRRTMVFVSCQKLTFLPPKRHLFPWQPKSMKKPFLLCGPGDGGSRVRDGHYLSNHTLSTQSKHDLLIYKIFSFQEVRSIIQLNLQIIGLAPGFRKIMQNDVVLWKYIMFGEIY